jgi:glycosyltransferase involved in cell wall biosynthesis
MVSLSIILPCYNEAENIPLILDRFAQVIDRDDIEVILVDNGSTDKTPNVISEIVPLYSFARSIRVNVNEGYGNGLYIGLRHGRGRFLGWTHADMQTDPFDVLKALNIMEASEEPCRTFVKGLRKNRPWSDEIFTMGMSVLGTLVLKAPLWDINAQPNLFPKDFFDKCLNAPKDFSFDLYCYWMAVYYGLNIKRFDVHFRKRIHGESHWNISWQEKMKFIRRTVNFIFKLKRAVQEKTYIIN